MSAGVNNKDKIEEVNSISSKDEELDDLLNDSLKDFNDSDFNQRKTNTESELSSKLSNEFDYTSFGNIWNEAEVNEIVSDIEKCMKSLLSTVLNDKMGSDTKDSGEEINKLPEPLLKIAGNMFKFGTEELANISHDKDRKNEKSTEELFKETIERSEAANNVNGTLKKDTSEFQNTILKTINGLCENLKELDGNLINFEEFKNLLFSTKFSVGDSDVNGETEINFADHFINFVKKYLYPPLKELCEKYQSFLEKKTLSEQDYIYYENQYKVIDELCKLYEDNSNENESVQNDKFNKIFSVMGKIQNFGDPPKELVKENIFSDHSKDVTDSI